MVFKTLGELEKMCGIEFDKAGPEGRAAPPRTSGLLGTLRSGTACAAAQGQGAQRQEASGRPHAIQVHMSGEPWVVWVRGLTSEHRVAGAQRLHCVQSRHASTQQVHEECLRPPVGPTGGTLPPVGPHSPARRSLRALRPWGADGSHHAGGPCEFPSWRGIFPGRGVHRRQNS